MTLPDAVGLASFAATCATLAFAVLAEVRARLVAPTHGDFSQLSGVL